MNALLLSSILPGLANLRTMPLRKKPHIITYLNLEEEEGAEESDSDHSNGHP